MSHALATVLHRGRKAASNVIPACLPPHGKRVEERAALKSEALDRAAKLHAPSPKPQAPSLRPHPAPTDA
jgi:hypothetical protein